MKHAPTLFSSLALLLATNLLPVNPLLACGNQTHAWITIDALSQLPAGELKSILTDPVLEPFLRNGTMFPDGGYAVDDNYGEIAHWENFQDGYLDWILSQFGTDFSSGEAREHLAFWLGMASHGMADQVFDATFVESSRLHDAAGWGSCSSSLCQFDTMSDVMWAHFKGPQPTTDTAFPAEVMQNLLDTNMGHSVDIETMTMGLDLVEMGLEYVGAMSQEEDQVAQTQERYPWSFEAMPRRETYGAPISIGKIVSLYWQTLFKRAHGFDWRETPVMATLPVDGGYGHPTDSNLWESRISIVFNRALLKEPLTDSQFSVTDSDGNIIPVRANLYYRDNSHVVNLQPETDFLIDTQYVVTVRAGITAIDGEVSSKETIFTFSTSEPPPECDTLENEEPTAEESPEAGGCAALGAPMELYFLLILLLFGAGRVRRGFAHPRNGQNIVINR